MKQYSNYKDSGVEWLGEIPDHWELRKVTHSFNLIGSGTTPKAGTPEFYNGGTINWVNTGDLNNGYLSSCKKNYYQKTTLESATASNHLYDLRSVIESSQVIWQTEVDNFAKVFFQPNYIPKDQKKLYAYIDPAVERFMALPGDKAEGVISQDDVRDAMVSFTRLYGYLSQVMPFYDMILEKLYPYLRLFLKKMPKETVDPRLILDDKVTFEYYRIEKAGQKDISLVKEDAELEGVSEAGIKRKTKEEKAPLSEIIHVINERWGTDFEEADRLVFEQVENKN